MRCCIPTGSATWCRSAADTQGISRRRRRISWRCTWNLQGSLRRKSRVIIPQRWTCHSLMLLPLNLILPPPKYLKTSNCHQLQSSWISVKFPIVQSKRMKIQRRTTKSPLQLRWCFNQGNRPIMKIHLVSRFNKSRLIKTHLKIRHPIWSNRLFYLL